MPEFLGGIVQSRSGIAIKHSIECSNAGVIDHGYTDEIHVKIYNHDPREPWAIKFGDRIAQLCLHIKPAKIVDLLEIFFKDKNSLVFSIQERDISTWPQTARGNKGIGSSGR
jgi:dUTPase